MSVIFTNGGADVPMISAAHPAYTAKGTSDGKAAAEVAGKNKIENSQATDNRAVTAEPTSVVRDNTADRVEISAEARKKTQASKGFNQTKLDVQEEARLRQLQATDVRVRAHERAHLAAAGGVARSGASFSTTRGPDGRLYATGGEVAIDASPVPGDPDATITKAAVVRRAALAPANPSSQDRAVAAKAGAMAAEARAEKLREDDSESESMLKPADASSDNRPQATGLEPTEQPHNPVTSRGDLLDLLV
jgi:hypothetical protein